DPENYYYGEMLSGKNRITKSFQKKMDELGLKPFGRSAQSIDPQNPADRPYANLAYVLQERTSQVICDIVRHFFTENPLTKGTDKLALSGGVALNILSNGKLITEGLIYGENIFVQPAAGDSGVSIGSALTVARELYGQDVNVEMDHAQYGPEYSNEEIRKVLEKAGLVEGVDFRQVTDKELIYEAADLIGEAKAIAWFQGRSEVGPRALGARSILLNLSDVRANNTANIIKGRQSWRPSASSVLEEAARDYFMGIGKAPFMIVAFPILHLKRGEVLSGAHEFGDKLARPQTVSKKVNPLYWALLDKLGKIGQAPAVVNTSFNKQEPLVEDPSEALDTFFYMERVEHLFIGNFIVDKTENLRPGIIALQDEESLQGLIKQAVGSGDMDVWAELFVRAGELYPKCRKIGITMDCGRYGFKSFEIPLVKEMFSGSLKEHLLRYISSDIFNRAAEYSAEKIYISTTSDKMGRVVYQLIKGKLTQNFPRMNYFANYGEDIEIVSAAYGDTIARAKKLPPTPRLERSAFREIPGRFIGIDVGATNIKCVLIENGVVKNKKEVPTAYTGGKELGNLISVLAMDLAGGKKVEGIGISLPGVVDARENKLKWLVNYEHRWRAGAPGGDMAEEYNALTARLMSLREPLGCGNIRLVNDGTAFGISVLNSSKENDAVVAALGTGIGAGRIRDGAIDISRIEQSGAFVVNAAKDAERDAGCEVSGCFSGVLRDSTGTMRSETELALQMIKWFKTMHLLNGDSNFIFTGGATFGKYGKKLIDEINRILREDQLVFKASLSDADRVFGAAEGAAQLSMSLSNESVMEEIHRINMSMLPPRHGAAKINYLISEDLVPIGMRNSLNSFLAELYKKYPFLKEKEEIKVVKRDVLAATVNTILFREDKNNVVSVALSNASDIALLPEGVRALVFIGNSETDDFVHLEGIIAALKALQQGDINKLMSLYRALSGKEF
ncbi:MAG: ROK family protein, partial [Candidatus Omnitrophota bacterium]